MQTEFLEIRSNNPDRRVLDKTVTILKKGGLVIYPTDTVYSLGCDINNLKAMEKLAKFKKISLRKARFSIVCNDLSHLSEFTKQIDRSTYKILKRAFPGAYTFILEASKSLPSAYKGHKTVGIRVPNHSIPQEIVGALNSPIVSTSIHNEEDEIMDYITDPHMIFERYDGKVDLILGAEQGNLSPSTVIDLSTSPYEIIRQGAGSLSILE